MVAQRPLTIIDGQVQELSLHDTVVVGIGAIEENIEGNLATLPVTDNEVISLLTRILKELMKMNIQLSLLTDAELTSKDTEV